MERLTRPNLNVDPDTDRFLHAAIGGKEIDWKQSRDSTLNVLINGPTSNCFGKDIFRKMARDLYGRLKAYEDTGIEPEAVETVKLALCAKHEVVHGRWKKVQKTGSTWECSACGVKAGAFLAGCSQYCYCCGARMDMDGAAE